MSEYRKLVEKLERISEGVYPDEQQIEFKKVIPKVEYVLNKHSNVLSSKELEMLQLYQRYITNKETSLDFSVLDKVKPMIDYLSRV